MLYLLRFLAFLGILWMVRKLLGSFFVKSRRPTSSGTAQTNTKTQAPTSTVKDPVCGMYMDPRLAIRSGDDFFCSEDCLHRHTENPPS